MRIAIMQPYFMPYGGYFRLMASADLFVFYDCVQFPRRGWVHRNKLTHQNGQLEWLTLPLASTARDTRIKDLEFASQAQQEWEKRLQHFPVITQHWQSPLVEQIKTLHDTPCRYIQYLLIQCCKLLDIDCKFTCSSDLNLPDTLKSQDRILAIVKHFGASHYVNAPGGRDLYAPDAFATEGIQLEFLPEYDGGYTSILERLLSQPAGDIAAEIIASSTGRQTAG